MRRNTYYKAIERRLAHPDPFRTLMKDAAPALVPFSPPDDVTGYGASPITNNMVTEVYNEWSTRVRELESEQYLKILTGKYSSWPVPVVPSKM